MRTLLILLCLCLCGCAVQEDPAPSTMPPSTTTPMTEETFYVQEARYEMPTEAAWEAVAMTEAPEPAVPVILEAEPSGELEERCEDAVIDYSHTDNGYVMVRYTTQTEKRLKVLVGGPETTYTYNLPADEWTVFPLSDGNGIYRVGVYINTTGSKYASVMIAEFEVALQDEFAPFLRPNQYVNYALAENTLAKGAELCTGLDNPLDKVASVYDFVVDTLEYDYEKAATVKSGYLPELDTVLAEKKGICFDYAALMTAMLRSQQVPCKLVVGFAGETYHAWISVWIEEHGWVDGAIFFDGQAWQRMDPTFASSGHRSPEIMDFIKNGSYTVKYLY